MNRPVLTVFCLLVAIPGPVRAVEQPEGTPEYHQFADGGRLALSADARWLAYTVRNGLWVTEVGTGKSRRVDQPCEKASAPRWAPDGKRLAYFVETDGGKQLRVWNRETEKVHPVPDATVFTINLSQPPQWSPDGKHLWFIAVVPNALGSDAGKPASPNGAASGEKSSPPTTPSKPFVQVYTSSTAKPNREPAPAPGVELSTKVNDSEVERFGAVRDVVVVDVVTGRLTRVMRGKGLISLTLSPDGKTLAVMGNWRRETDDQDLLDLYVVPSLPAPDRAPTPAPVPLKPSVDALDATGRPLVPIAKALREASGMNVSWSPDSRQIAFGTRGKLAPEDVFIADVAAGKVQNLTTGLNVPPGPKSSRTRWYVYDPRPTPKFYSDLCPPLWTRDGKALLSIGQGDVWLIPIKPGAEARNLTKGLDRQVDHVLHANDGNRVLYSEDGNSVFALTHDPKEHRYGVCRIDLTNGKAEQLWEEAKRIGDSEGYLREDVAVGAGRIAQVIESATLPPEVWLSDRSFRSPRQITHINPPADPKRTGTVRVLRWKTRQGQEAEGFLTLPPGAGPANRVPLIVAPALGTTGSSGLLLRFREPRDAHGYASLSPDIPVGKGDQTDAIVGSVLPALDAAVATGVIDPERIGLMGHSIGGYTVNVLITNTDRFKAAVSGAGISDWGSFCLSKHRVINPGAEDLAPPWKDPSGYIKNSPIYHLDKVSTPVLLLHGTADASVPVEQSEAMFQGLKLLGREAELVEYPGVGHQLTGDPNVSRDRDERILAWFDRYLKPPRK